MFHFWRHSRLKTNTKRVCQRGQAESRAAVSQLSTRAAATRCHKRSILDPIQHKIRIKKITAEYNFTAIKMNIACCTQYIQFFGKWQFQARHIFYGELLDNGPIGADIKLSSKFQARFLRKSNDAIGTNKLHVRQCDVSRAEFQSKTRQNLCNFYSV